MGHRLGFDERSIRKEIGQSDSVFLHCGKFKSCTHVQSFANVHLALVMSSENRLEVNSNEK